MNTGRFAIVFLFVFSILGCRPAAAPVSVSNTPVSINDRTIAARPSKPFTEMEWTTIDGQTIKLGDLAGKVVILDFWATNCPPCREEIPHLNALIAKHGADNLSVVGLHVGDDEDRKLIPEFTATTRIEYTIGFPERALSRFIFAESDAIPQTAVFDRQGLLVAKIAGFNPEIQRTLDTAVERALSSN